MKLELAISPGTWLMPSRLVLNTESTVGYNNKLIRVNSMMHLGVNSDVNSDGIVDVGIRRNLGSSKKKLPQMLRKVGDTTTNNIESLDDKTS